MESHLVGHWVPYQADKMEGGGHQLHLAGGGYAVA